MDSGDVKKFLIRKLVVETAVPEATVDAIIKHQCRKAVEATKTCKSIELSGFGKFIFNHKKALRYMDKYSTQVLWLTEQLNDSTLSDTKRRNVTMRLNSNKKYVEELTPIINGI